MSLEIVEEPTRAATLLEPNRLRLIRELGDGASATELARRLHMPRQRVNYHLRQLEEAGLITLTETRQKGNCTERILRPSAERFVISPAALGEVGADLPPSRERFSWSYLVSVAARAIRDLAILRRRADKAGKKVATLTLETEITLSSATAQRQFAEELSEAFARIAARYNRPTATFGRKFRVFAGSYSAITKDDDEE
ncbi:helix-turn-helix domain-containing protein [candidate division GN15 bacterium]|nr:helix-turn-helix domain-containing protein [candidate division GN15 bacterium]